MSQENHSSQKKKRLAVLISGRGSNMQSIYHATQNPDYPGEIALVLSNRPNAAGLNFAQEHNISSLCLDHKAYESRSHFENALDKALKDHKIDLICLAGFMRILGKDFISRWDAKILNIHPSLLPKFKGLNPQKQALAAGESKSGCSVHVVTPALDDGPVIAFAEVGISENETEETLSVKILEKEHILYPCAIAEYIEKTL